MTDHYPDCPLSQPCQVEWRRADLIDDTHPHRIVSGSSGNCVECDVGNCCCEELRSFGQRIREAVEDALAVGLQNSSDGALYYFELSEDDPTCGYDVTFAKDSLIAAIDRVMKEGT